MATIYLSYKLKKEACPKNSNQLSSSLRKAVSGKVGKVLTPLFSKFEGNTLYEEMLAEIKGVDWIKTDTNALAKFGRSIADKAKGFGSDASAALVSEVIVAWGVGMGYALGPWTGGISAAAGLGIKWGFDTLLDNYWPLQDEFYRPGDVVVVNTRNLTRRDALTMRRRMPDNDVLDLGIVTSGSQNGFVGIVDITSQEKMNAPTETLAKVPNEQILRMEDKSPQFKQLRDVVHLMNVKKHEMAHLAGHTTKIGDSVVYRDDRGNEGRFTIVAHDPYEHTITIENDQGVGHTVPVGSVTDGWNQSISEKDSLLMGFQQGVSQGMFYYAPARPGQDIYHDLELVCLMAVTTKDVRVCYGFDGEVGTVKTRELRECDVDRGAFAEWVTACVQGDKKAMKNKNPGNNPHGGSVGLCFANSSEIQEILPSRPAADYDDPPDVTARTKSRTVWFEDETVANIVDTRNAATGDWGYNVWGDMEEEPRPEVKSGNGALLMVGAGLLLAVMLWR